MKNIVFVPLKDYFISRKWVFIKFLFPNADCFGRIIAGDIF